MTIFKKIIVSAVFFFIMVAPSSGASLFSLWPVGAVPALAAAIKPATIPCVPSLPCVSEETQADRKKVQEHITQNVAKTFFTTFLGVSGLTSVIFIIVGGLRMHLALGNEEALGKAKKTLLWAIAGLVLVILSVSIIQITTKIYS